MSEHEIILPKPVYHSKRDLLRKMPYIKTEKNYNISEISKNTNLLPLKKKYANLSKKNLTYQNFLEYNYDLNNITENKIRMPDHLKIKKKYELLIDSDYSSFTSKNSNKNNKKISNFLITGLNTPNNKYKKYNQIYPGKQNSFENSEIKTKASSNKHTKSFVINYNYSNKKNYFFSSSLSKSFIHFHGRIDQFTKNENKDEGLKAFIQKSRIILKEKIIQKELESKLNYQSDIYVEKINDLNKKDFTFRRNYYLLNIYDDIYVHYLRYLKQQLAEESIKYNKSKKQKIMLENEVTNILKKIEKNKAISKSAKINNEKEKTNYLLSNEVVIGSDKKFYQNGKQTEQDDLSLFTKLSISKLNDENKRLGYMGSENALLSKKNTYNRKLIEKFLDTLLRPNDWFDKKVMAELAQKLPFKLEEILYLIDEVTKIAEKENSLIKIRSPCKIFGNIYGVYTDLMRYFESYGNPSDNIQNGDINVMQYIFLGDFCDRGNQSLEVILLLFALKVKYPDFIYLIRGHHEDKAINEFYGLGKECTEKLKEDIKNEESVFNKINQVFDLLPFGVLVDNTILCIHGGIGASIKSLDDISNIPRPTKIYQNPESYAQMNILDLLYSEYDNEEDDESYSVNTLRDKNQKGFIVNYGKKRLDEFMQGNNINLIIAAHKFVKEGFCTYCDDKLLNLFSCTNYMDKNNNVGAMIIIGKKAKNKNANIMPKLLGVNENKNKNSQFRKDKSPSPLKIK